MDIRWRLALALSPLLGFVLVLLIIVPILQVQVRSGVITQLAGADRLIESQQTELALLLVHESLGQMVEGDSEPVRLQVWREQVRSGLDTLRTPDESGAMLPPGVVESFVALNERHELILARLTVGNTDAARALYNDLSTFLLVEEVVISSQDAREARQAELAASRAAFATTQMRNLGISVGVAILSVLLAGGASWFLMGQVARPIENLTLDAERFIAGDNTRQLTEVRGIAQLTRLRNAFQQLIDENARREQRIEAALVEREEQLAREEQLRSTVSALTMPVVPLRDRVLLLPLVGYLDERRSAQLLQEMLQAIQRSRARLLVLDLTGLVSLDGQTADSLRRAVDGARLLGCRVTIVGIRAKQAPALIAGDLNLANMTVARDIASALELEPEYGGTPGV
jgi:anti-anti-sigma regulatory factor